ncbi:hypothetical protein CapIbe_000040 [Capra ibex]
MLFLIHLIPLLSNNYEVKKINLNSKGSRGSGRTSAPKEDAGEPVKVAEQAEHNTLILKAVTQVDENTDSLIISYWMSALAWFPVQVYPVHLTSPRNISQLHLHASHRSAFLGEQDYLMLRRAQETSLKIEMKPSSLRHGAEE